VKLTAVHPVKKLPAFYGTLKFYYRVYKIPQPIPILSQISTVDVSPFHFFKIPFIISHLRKSSKWSLSLRFPHQNPVCTSPHTCCFPCPSRSWFNRPNDIWWRVYVINHKRQIYWRNFAHERTDTHAQANTTSHIFVAHLWEINASWVTADWQHELLNHMPLTNPPGPLRCKK